MLRRLLGMDPDEKWRSCSKNFRRTRLFLVRQRLLEEVGLFCVNSNGDMYQFGQDVRYPVLVSSLQNLSPRLCEKKRAENPNNTTLNTTKTPTTKSLYLPRIGFWG
jgi:hypothetical protein